MAKSLPLRWLSRLLSWKHRRATHPGAESKQSHFQTSSDQKEPSAEDVDKPSYSGSPILVNSQLWMSDSPVESVGLQSQVPGEALDSDNKDFPEDPLGDRSSTLVESPLVPHLSGLYGKGRENGQENVQVPVSQHLQLVPNDPAAQRPLSKGDHHEHPKLNDPQHSGKSGYNIVISPRELDVSQMEGPDTSGIIEEDYRESDDDGTIDELSTIESESFNDDTGVPKTPEPRSEIQLRGPQLNDSEKILKLHMGILGLRSYIQEKRQFLREKQLARSVADDRLIQFIRQREFGTLRSSKTDVAKIDITELLKDSEQIRDEYGPLEDELNSLEDDLGRQEYQFLELLKRSSMLEEYNSNGPERKSTPVIGPYAASESSDNSYMEDLVRKPHPLVSRYHSKLGDLHILHERLAENREERDDLEEERETRKRVGLTLGTEDQDFLDNFPALEKSLLEKIAKAKEKVDRMKKKCLDQGLINENGGETDFATQELKSFDEESDLSSITAQSEFVKFPMLLPDPNKQVYFGDTVLDANEKPESPGHLVDLWLLQQLRSSPLAVNLLATTYESDGRKINKNWETNVLALWFLDEPPPPPPESPEPSLRSVASLQHSS